MVFDVSRCVCSETNYAAKDQERVELTWQSRERASLHDSFPLTMPDTVGDAAYLAIQDEAEVSGQ